MRRGREGESVEQGGGWTMGGTDAEIRSDAGGKKCWEWERWRNELSRRHREMDTARGSRKWDWGSQQPMGRGQMPAQQCRSAAWLLWTVLRGAFKTRSWELLGRNWPFCLSLSPTRSWCFASSQPNLWSLPDTVLSARGWIGPSFSPASPEVRWATAACSLRGSRGAADAEDGGCSLLCGFGGDGCLASWWRHQCDAEEDVAPLAGISPLLESLVEWNKKC